MIETYQEKESLAEPKPETQNFATIGEIYDDGVSLIFDGETDPSEKHYKTNAFVVFKKGDRVRIIADSGTYVVEYPVGNPKKIFDADTAQTAQTAQTAKKLANTTVFELSGDATGSGLFDGSNKCVIDTTGIRCGALINSYTSSPSYNIYFYAKTSNQLYFRVGQSGNWYLLQNA